jgi:hypothetical protein
MQIAAIDAAQLHAGDHRHASRVFGTAALSSASAGNASARDSRQSAQSAKCAITVARSRFNSVFSA